MATHARTDIPLNNEGDPKTNHKWKENLNDNEAHYYAIHSQKIHRLKTSDKNPHLSKQRLDVKTRNAAKKM